MYAKGRIGSDFDRALAMVAGAQGGTPEESAALREAMTVMKSAAPERPGSEPMVKAIRAARREHAKSPAGQLDALLKEEARWRRKRTIASNKLEEIRDRLNRFAIDLLPES